MFKGCVECYEPGKIVDDCTVCRGRRKYDELEDDLKNNFGVVVDDCSYNDLLQIKKEEELKFKNLTEEELTPHIKKIKLFNFPDSKEGREFTSELNKFITVSDNYTCYIDDWGFDDAIPEFKKLHDHVKKLDKILEHYNA